MTKHWQWGHPDDWTEAEWAARPASRHWRRLWNATQYVSLLGGAAVIIYWLGVGW